MELARNLVFTKTNHQKFILGRGELQIKHWIFERGSIKFQLGHCNLKDLFAYDFTIKEFVEIRHVGRDHSLPVR